MVLKNKNANCDLLPHNTNFFSQLCKKGRKSQLPSLFLFCGRNKQTKKGQNWDVKTKFAEKKPQLWDINLELWEKVKIPKFKFGIVGKSKNSEI